MEEKRYRSSRKRTHRNWTFFHMKENKNEFLCSHTSTPSSRKFMTFGSFCYLFTTEGDGCQSWGSFPGQCPAKLSESMNKHFKKTGILSCEILPLHQIYDIVIFCCDNWQILMPLFVLGQTYMRNHIRSPPLLSDISLFFIQCGYTVQCQDHTHVTLWSGKSTNCPTAE